MAKRSTAAKLSAVHRRLRLLRNEAAAGPEDDRLAAGLAELEARVAELEVAHQELEQQNEELIETREALENQRHRYRDLFERAPFGYLVTDASGIIEEANEFASTLFGIPRERMEEKSLLLHLAGESRERIRSWLTRLRTDSEKGEWQVVVCPRKGEPFPALITAVRDLDSADGRRRLRWTVHDLSEREAAAQALRESEDRLRHSQRMETVGRLAGGIAHSFNNLLAAISF